VRPGEKTRIDARGGSCQPVAAEGPRRVPPLNGTVARPVRRDGAIVRLLSEDLPSGRRRPNPGLRTSPQTGQRPNSYFQTNWPRATDPKRA